jgi:hypothetical protein
MVNTHHDHPDLLGLLARVALGDDTAIDIAADWLEDRGDPRAVAVRESHTDGIQDRRAWVPDLFRVLPCLACELDMVEPHVGCPECRAVRASRHRAVREGRETAPSSGRGMVSPWPGPLDLAGRCGAVARQGAGRGVDPLAGSRPAQPGDHDALSGTRWPGG